MTSFPGALDCSSMSVIPETITSGKSTFSRFCMSHPRVFLSSIDHFMRWSIYIFKELESVAQVTRSQMVLKHGVDVLVVPELADKVSKLFIKSFNYAKGEEVLKNVLIDVIKVSNKTVEFAKVLLEFNLIFISKVVTNRLTFIQGITMMANHSIKLCSLGDHPSGGSTQLLRTAKHASLLAFGAFLILGSLTGLINPTIMLALSSVSLASSCVVFWLKSNKSPIRGIDPEKSRIPPPQGLGEGTFVARIEKEPLSSGSGPSSPIGK